MTDRRTFLKSAGLFTAALPLLGRATAAEPTLRPAPPEKFGPERGLLFDAADLPRIRANLETPRFRDLRAILFPADMAAPMRFLRDEIRMENLVQDFAHARQLLEAAAFAYALTHDAAQLALAKLALQRVCEYSRWDYFLEGGQHTIGLQRASEATVACVLALDWLGDTLTPAERATVEHNVVTKGAPACYLSLYGMKYPDRVRGWTQDPREHMPFKMDMRRWPLILNATNLKVIPTCGLGYAAILFHGRHAEADKWLNLARQSARAFSTMYGLDGAYDEGAGYWGYTTTYLILFAEALYRRTGVDDRSLINYPGTVRYALCMAMPTLGAPPPVADPKKPYDATPHGGLDPARDVVNFSDSGLALDVSIAPWVGHTDADPVSNYVAQNIGGMRQLHAAIWYRPDAPVQAPGPELYDVHLSNDLVISRTGWAAEDSVVAFRSGGPANHEHADRNSVIFKAYGERLFHDPARAAYVTSSPRWLLRLTEAHTAVLINGKGHQYHDGSEGTNSSWASARVTDFHTGPGWMRVTSDATDAYQLVNPSVVGVERTLVYLKPDVLLVLDRVRLKDAPATVQMRYQVFNDDTQGSVTASADGFAISRPHATLAATVHSAGALTVRADKLALPAEEGIQPFAEVGSAGALTHEILTVASAQKAGGTHGAFAVSREGAGWRVRGSHNGRAVAVLITPTGEGPPDVVVERSA